MEKLYAALSKAQGEFPTVHFDATGQAGGGKYRYASLGAIWSAVRPTLCANGLSVVQLPTAAQDGLVALRTILAHASGETIEATATMPGGKTPQQQGSAYTYLRRYALAACLGIVAEDDDDGASASKPVPAPVPAKAPAPVPAEPFNAASAIVVLWVPVEDREKACAAVIGGANKATIADLYSRGVRWDRAAGQFVTLPYDPATVRAFEAVGIVSLEALDLAACDIDPDKPEADLAALKRDGYKWNGSKFAKGGAPE